MRHRDQLEDSMFRWARTEMKKEIVMASSSYAKIAGLQSEIGRVVVTRVAGSELEYNRMLNMYRKDMVVSVNNIRREQIKMRRSLGKYVKKLKQTRQQNLKRQQEEEKRDSQRRYLEALQKNLKFDTPSTSGTPADGDIEEPPSSPPSPGTVDFKDGPAFLQTATEEEVTEAPSKVTHFPKGSDTDRQHTNKADKSGFSKEARAYSPILPMINEDRENECEEEQLLDSNSNEIPSKSKEDSAEVFDEKKQDTSNSDGRSLADDLSVSSSGRKRKVKKEVSFSDIIKLRYNSNTKQLVNMVHILAKKHGVTLPLEAIPDPRDSVVLRGSTDQSFRLQAAVLYPMKYGYGAETEASPPATTPLPSLSNSQETLSNSVSPGGSRGNISVEKRREHFLSGRSSKSEDFSGDSTNVPNTAVRERKFSEPRMKARDSSLPLLVEKVSRIKMEQAERLTEADHNFRMMLPAKPSSSRSTKSLPALSKQASGEGDRAVSWTHAFGLLRSIHSLDNVVS